MKIQIAACDVDRRTPAKTYRIKTDDGETVEIDLCQEHADPIEALITFARGGEAPRSTASSQSAPVPTPASASPARPDAPSPAPVRSPARKPVSNRRRPRVVTMEEIEAKKKAKKAREGA